MLKVSGKLQNTPSDTVRGPLAIRVKRLGSGVSVPVIVNAENGAAGTGAIWRFDEALIAPNAKSRSREFVFRLEDFAPLGDFLRKEFDRGDAILSFDVAVFGKRPPQRPKPEKKDAKE